MAYHRVLHVGVYARLLRVDTDLDRIVDTPAKPPSASLRSKSTKQSLVVPLDRNKDMQPSRCCGPHRLRSLFLS